ncbi:MAG TPA: DUF6263 family protein [Planctomycetaceae bacterium]|nr:DUF6263 family protein [Planctomycetaceae bacterium]
MSLRRLGLATITALFALSGLASADEPVLLRYKLAKGDSLIYKTVQEQKSTQTVMGNKVESSTIQEAVNLSKVDDVDAKGNAILKTKAERRKVTMDSPNGKYEFDSKSTERDTTSAVGGFVTPILERLTGSEYQMTVSPRGEVVEVKGFAELIADLVANNPFGISVAGGGGNEGAKYTEQDSYVVFGDKPVKPGDQWETPVEIELASLGKAKGKVTCVYEGNDKVRDRKTVRIGITANMTIELNLDAGGMKISGTMSTTNSSGTVQFDPAAGRVVSSKRSVSMSGQLTVEVGGTTIPVDSETEQTSTSQLLNKLPE